MGGRTWGGGGDLTKCPLRLPVNRSQSLCVPRFLPFDAMVWFRFPRQPDRVSRTHEFNSATYIVHCKRGLIGSSLARGPLKVVSIAYADRALRLGASTEDRSPRSLNRLAALASMQR